MTDSYYDGDDIDLLMEDNIDAMWEEHCKEMDKKAKQQGHIK